MSVKISTTNSKLGLIPSINLPPVVTCRPNCPCSKGCYAMKGRFRYASVRQNMQANYEEYIISPASYFEQIKKYISTGVITYRYFRWHASGDIIDRRYLEGMIKLANELPGTEFLAFTKKFELINDYVATSGMLPSNLTIVFSAWGDVFAIDNPYHFPVAHVRFKDCDNKSIPSDAIECSGDCTRCLKCWNIKHGEAVVFDKH